MSSAPFYFKVMSDFGTLAANLKKISPNRILKNILSKSDIQSWIKTTIKNRVQTTGIVADGTKLKTDQSKGGQHYSAFTIFLKNKFNSGIAGITDHVTLTESGKFWESLKVIIKENSFETQADFMKSAGHMHNNFTSDFASRKEFEDAVDGLSYAELQQLTEQKISPEFIEQFNNLI